MAYGFNEDRSKVEVYTKSEAKTINDSIETEINQILREQDLNPNKDHELVNVRTGYDGTEYSTAGDAVRDQIKKVNIVEEVHNLSSIVVPNKFSAFGSLGLYTVGGTTGEYDYKVVSSPIRIGFSDFQFSNSDIVIKFNRNIIRLGAQVFERNADGDFGFSYSPFWFDTDYSDFLVSDSTYELSVVIPKGVWYFVCFSYPDERQIVDIDTFIDLIDSNCKIYTSDTGVFKPSELKGAVIASTTFGNISIKKAEQDTLLSCDDWSARICDVYKYNSDDPLGEPVNHFSIETDYVIKKGEYYRYAVRFRPAVDIIDSNVSTLSESLHESNVDWRNDILDFINVNSPLGDNEVDVFSGTDWGYYRADINNQTTEVVVSQTAANNFGMSGFKYAETDLLLFGKASADVTVGFFCCKKGQDEKFYNQVLSWYRSDWFNYYEAYPIPKGCYYWIGFRKSPVSAIPSQSDYMDTVRGHFSILKIPIGGCLTANPGLAPTYGAVSNISIKKAESDMRVIPNDDSVLLRVAFYDSDKFDANQIGGKPNATNFPVTIPKGTFYRLTFSYADSRTLSSVEDFYELLTHFSIVGCPDEYKEPSTMAMRSLNSELSLMRRRIARLESNSIPNYYVNHINSKLSTINSLKPDNGSQFIFITDVHYNGYNNAKHSKALINYLCDNSSIDFVVNGGDILSVPDDQQNETSLMEVVRDSFLYTKPDNDVPHFFVFGNHDNGIDYIHHDGVVDTYGPYLDPQKVILSSGNPVMEKIIRMDQDGYGQYYYDDDNVKIRYIFGAIDVGDILGQRWASAVNFIIASMVSCPENYKIILFNHIIVNSDDQFYPPDQIISNMVDAYNARTSYTYWNLRYDLSEVKGRVILIIGGHSHKDLSLTTPGGTKVIVTTTDNAGAEIGSLNRTIGTINEQAFDVFTVNLDTNQINITRIGAGSDRLITF